MLNPGDCSLGWELTLSCICLWEPRSNQCFDPLHWITAFRWFLCAKWATRLFSSRRLWRCGMIDLLYLPGRSARWQWWRCVCVCVCVCCVRVRAHAPPIACFFFLLIAYGICVSQHVNACQVLSSMIGFALPNVLPKAYTHYAGAVLFTYFGWE